MQDIEFRINDIVTVDRYNHIDDMCKGTIKEIRTEALFSDGLSYGIDIDGLRIHTSGRSIVESKYYIPVDPSDRHEKKPIIITKKQKL
jgi:hypothetical protein